MTDPRLPVLRTPYGPHAALALHVHDLTIRGQHPETLLAADEAEFVAGLLGDTRSARVARLGRMYALSHLARLDEALAVSEELTVAPDPALTGPLATDAKLLADTAEVLIKLGRIDDGLHCMARAMTLLDVAPRPSRRYMSAMSSLSEAAQAAELYEYADLCARSSIDSRFDEIDVFRAGAEIQRAELLLEWALRLEQVNRHEEASTHFATGVRLLRPWTDDPDEGPLAAALLAVGLAKTGQYAEAHELVDRLLLRMRAAGQGHETRLLHLAYGLVLRAAGDLRAARREFIAADEFVEVPGQRMVIRYELATLAVLETPGPATRTMLATVHAQIELLWRLRLDRRMMLRQAYRRVELEAARTRADRDATFDALTGLGNRRMFDTYMGSVRDGGVLLLIDVDRFKGINDRYSHGVGDRVLGEIAAVLSAHCRHDEVAIRFGGDEFAMFLRMDVPSAAIVAERIRQVILARDWGLIAAGLRVTLSIGMAPFSTGMSGAELYDRADGHLYLAKRQGRNQVAA